MWTSHLINGVMGLASGVAVATGTFAFILVIGILPRFLGWGRLGEYVILVENVVTLGVIYGAIYSLFPIHCTWQINHVLLAVGGLSMGVFVGCISGALAEILHTFPIMFRRLRVKVGLPWVMGAMALGKLTGSLFYFFCGYGIGNS